MADAVVIIMEKEKYKKHWMNTRYRKANQIKRNDLDYKLKH